MSDLIRREAVIKAMENNSFMVEVYGTKRKMIDGMMMCCDIAELPTIEAVPVVHGEWILRHIGVGHMWECSVCHKRPDIYVKKDTNYCPQCGAKMDGGAE